MNCFAQNKTARATDFKMPLFLAMLSALLELKNVGRFVSGCFALAALPIEESTGGSWSSHGVQTWLISSAMSEMAW